MKHSEDMKELFYSMISAFTTAIDERTPYNANHTKHVAQYTGELIDYINKEHKRGNTALFFETDYKEQIVMAALLHDIGKLVTPLEIMNKATRLGKHFDAVMSHLDLISAWIKIDYLERRITNQVWKREEKYLKHVKNLVTCINTAPFLEENMLKEIADLKKKQYTKQDGEIIFYITDSQAEDLLIKKGTLSPKEREIIEDHVTMTSKLLEQIDFGKMYAMVPELAGKHHEFLNGTGYPKHLTAEDIPIGARILVIMDIFDSLISIDRPYKQPISKQSAFIVLWEMVEEGKLDRELVKLWEMCKQNIKNRNDK